MQEIIEILFEDVQLEKLAELLMKVNSSSILEDYQISSDGPEIEINLQYHNILIDTINQSSDGSFYFNFSEFKLNGIELSIIGFQIYKYDNKYDLNLHLKQMEISQVITIFNLRSWTEILAGELKAKNYFCGHEPASDKETQFFSKESIGPLKCWGIKKSFN